VPILQFLDTEPAYETFRLNEAWDSPHNRPLSENGGIRHHLCAMMLSRRSMENEED
jgi:hypothetical protein